MTTKTDVPRIFTSNAKDFVDYILGKTNKNQVLQTKGWKSFVEECRDTSWLNDWAKSHIEDQPDNTDHICPEYMMEALRDIRNSFLAENINFAVDPDLTSVLADKGYIEALDADIRHIGYMKSCIGDLLSNCPAAVHFIGVGWFDEPFDHKGIDTILDLFEKSTDLAINMIIEEKTGTCYKSSMHRRCGCEGLFFPLERNGDSWNEWVHIFPNTIKFFLEEKFNLEKHLDTKHNFQFLIARLKGGNC